MTNGDAHLAVHLLDVGPREYGDAMLLQFQSRSVLIDGAHMGRQVGDAKHPSIPDQLSELLDQPDPPFSVDLMIISHAHQDHVGCLPHLVKNGLLRTGWALMPHPGAAFGRALDEPSPIDALDSVRVKSVLAALREETPHPSSSIPDLKHMLDAARTLEDRYIELLQGLETAGTTVVVPADPTGTDVDELLEEFDDIGLAIHGPDPELLAATAEGIRSAIDGAVDRVLTLANSDVAARDYELYRRLVLPGTDSLDAASRPGNLVNLQSFTTTFETQHHKLLLAGDMQFVDPGTGNDTIENAVEELRASLQAEAPFSFVKLSHHGSDNAFNAEILQEMGETKLFGICAGAHSSHHPHRDVLDLLEDKDDELTWVRSDRNGLTSIRFGDGDPEINVANGSINDPQSNDVDVAVAWEPEGGGLIHAPSREPRPEIRQSTGGDDRVEVLARIPHEQTRVRLTIEVDPGQVESSAFVSGSDQPVAVALGAGRELPSLLFATNIDALADNIGDAEAHGAVQAVEAAGQRLVNLPPPSSNPREALAATREALNNGPEVAGIVLLGGYNVVPSTRLDCLPARLRRALGTTGDPDDFVVWSDDAFGDVDDDLFPELPVSRIPDGRDRSLFLNALSATAPDLIPARSGIRNVNREFAINIYNDLAGDADLLVSEPHVSRAGETAGVEGTLVYFMLHGDWFDSSRFWGEETGGLEAVNVGNIPDDTRGAVVFAGCCWGALSVDTPANRVALGRPFGQKTPNASMALGLLKRGARSFVGCTGAHYSPVDEPYSYFGGPMHYSFWRGISEGKSPAAALFEAKVEYAINMPHGLSRPLEVAVEYKTLRQFSCLGLGW